MQLNPALTGGPAASVTQQSAVSGFVGDNIARLRDMSAAARSATHSLSAVLGLLDRTLDLARLEAGHGTVTPSRFQVSALWRDVVVAVSPAFRQGGVKLTVRMGDVSVTANSRMAFPDMWQEATAAKTWVLGDRLRLQQSLVALLDNAASYTAGCGAAGWRQ
jgi:signal transduction histidine kinase